MLYFFLFFYFFLVKGRPQLQFNFNFKIILQNLSCILLWLMFTYCFNNEFISIFFISLLCILYFYDDERCKINFPVRDNKVLLYCIVLYYSMFWDSYLLQSHISRHVDLYLGSDGVRMHILLHCLGNNSICYSDQWQQASSLAVWWALCRQTGNANG